MITSSEYASLKAIAEEGSINQGARTLGISVYKLRQRTALVEARLGIALIDHVRGRGGVRVTDNLDDLLRQYEAMEGRVKGAIGHPPKDAISAHKMKLGIMPTIGPQHVMAGYRRVESLGPVTVTTSFDSDPLALLRAGALDACIMAEPAYPADMARFVIATDPFVVAFSQGHPLEKMATITLDALDEFDNINRSLCEFPRYLALKTGIAKPAAAPANPPTSAHAITDEMVCQSLISQGVGIAIVPESLVLLQGVRSRRLTRPAISREISIVTPLDHVLGSHLRD
jgi:LysR family hydrogen peroxide-inducible transcriptional activator